MQLATDQFEYKMDANVDEMLDSLDVFDCWGIVSNPKKRERVIEEKIDYETISLEMPPYLDSKPRNDPERILHRKNIELSALIRRLDERNQQLAVKNGQLMEDIESMKSSVKPLQEKSKKFGAKNMQLNHTNRRLEGAIKELRNDLGVKEDKIVSLTALVEKKDKQQRKAKAKLKDNTMSEFQLTDFEEMQRTLSDQVQIIAELRQQNVEKDRLIDILRIRQSNRLKTSKSRSCSLQSLDNLTSANVKEELNDVSIENSDSMLDDVEYRSFKSSEAMRQMSMMEKEHLELQRAYDILNQEVGSNFDSERNELHFDALKSELLVAQTHSNKLESELQERDYERFEFEEEKQNMEEVIDDLKQKLITSESELVKKSIAIQKMTEEIKEVLDQNDLLEFRLEEIKQTCNLKNTTETTLKLTEENRAEFTTNIEEIEYDAISVRIALKEMELCRTLSLTPKERGTLTQARAIVDKGTKKIDDLQEREMSLKKRIDFIQLKYDEAKNEINDLKHELQLLREEKLSKEEADLLSIGRNSRAESGNKEPLSRSSDSTLTLEDDMATLLASETRKVHQLHVDKKTLLDRILKLETRKDKYLSDVDLELLREKMDTLRDAEKTIIALKLTNNNLIEKIKEFENSNASIRKIENAVKHGSIPDSIADEIKQIQEENETLNSEIGSLRDKAQIALEIANQTKRALERESTATQTEEETSNSVVHTLINNDATDLDLLKSSQFGEQNSTNIETLSKEGMVVVEDAIIETFVEEIEANLFRLNDLDGAHQDSDIIPQSLNAKQLQDDELFIESVLKAYQVDFADSEHSHSSKKSNGFVKYLHKSPQVSITDDLAKSGLPDEGSVLSAKNPLFNSKADSKTQSLCDSSVSSRTSSVYTGRSLETQKHEGTNSPKNAIKANAFQLTDFQDERLHVTNPYFPINGSFVSQTHILLPASIEMYSDSVHFTETKQSAPLLKFKSMLDAKVSSSHSIVEQRLSSPRNILPRICQITDFHNKAKTGTIASNNEQSRSRESTPPNLDPDLEELLDFGMTLQLSHYKQTQDRIDLSNHLIDKRDNFADLLGTSIVPLRQTAQKYQFCFSNGNELETLLRVSDSDREVAARVSPEEENIIGSVLMPHVDDPEEGRMKLEARNYKKNIVKNEQIKEDVKHSLHFDKALQNIEVRECKYPSTTDYSGANKIAKRVDTKSSTSASLFMNTGKNHENPEDHKIGESIASDESSKIKFWYKNISKSLNVKRDLENLHNEMAASQFITQPKFAARRHVTRDRPCSNALVKQGIDMSQDFEFKIQSGFGQSIKLPTIPTPALQPSLAFQPINHYLDHQSEFEERRNQDLSNCLDDFDLRAQVDRDRKSSSKCRRCPRNKNEHVDLKFRPQKTVCHVYERQSSTSTDRMLGGRLDTSDDSFSCQMYGVSNNENVIRRSLSTPSRNKVINRGLSRQLSSSDSSIDSLSANEFCRKYKSTTLSSNPDFSKTSRVPKSAENGNLNLSNLFDTVLNDSCETFISSDKETNALIEEKNKELQSKSEIIQEIARVLHRTKCELELKMTECSKREEELIASKVSLQSCLDEKRRIEYCCSEQLVSIAKLKTIEPKLIQMTAKYDDCLVQNKELAERVKSLEIAEREFIELEKNLIELEMKLRDFKNVESDRDELYLRLIEVKRQRDEFMEKGKRVESERNEFVKNTKTLEQYLDDWKNKTEIFEKTNNNLNQRVFDLERDKKELEEQIASIQKEKSGLRQKLCERDMQHDDLIRELKNVVMERNTMDARIEELEHMLGDQEHLEEGFHSLRMKVSGLKHQRDEAEKMAQKYKSRAKTLQNSCREKESTISQLTQDFNSLKIALSNSATDKHLGQTKGTDFTFGAQVTDNLTVSKDFRNVTESRQSLSSIQDFSNVNRCSLRSNISEDADVENTALKSYFIETQSPLIRGRSKSYFGNTKKSNSSDRSLSPASVFQRNMNKEELIETPVAPRDLRLLRIVSKNAVLLEWEPPPDDNNLLSGYYIWVNGYEKLFIKNPLSTKVIIDDINLHDRVEFSIEAVLGGHRSEKCHLAITGALAAFEDECDRRMHREPVIRYIALYDYDPYKSSPNPNPSLELVLKEGDIVYVSNTSRKDGFYHANVNGNHGLVPSNFISRLDNNEIDVN